MKQINLLFREDQYTTIDYGTIENVPGDFDLQSYEISVYEDFYGDKWICCNDNISRKSVFDFSEIYFFKNKFTYHTFNDNFFKCVIVYSFNNKEFTPKKIIPFFYDKGYLLKENELERMKPIKWLVPSNIYINVDNVTHLSFDGKINEYSDQHNEFSTLCKRHYNSSFSNVKFDKLEVFESLIDLKNKSIADIKKVITCKTCAQNYINFRKKLNFIADDRDIKLNNLKEVDLNEELSRIDTLIIKNLKEFKSKVQLKKYSKKFFLIQQTKNTENILNKYNQIELAFLDEETNNLTLPCFISDIKGTKNSIEFLKAIYSSLYKTIGNDSYNKIIERLVKILQGYNTKTIILKNAHNLSKYSALELNTVFQVLINLNKRLGIKIIFSGKGNYFNNIRWNYQILKKLLVLKVSSDYEIFKISKSDILYDETLYYLGFDISKNDNEKVTDFYYDFISRSSNDKVKIDFIEKKSTVTWLIKIPEEFKLLDVLNIKKEFLSEKKFDYINSKNLMKIISSNIN